MLITLSFHRSFLKTQNSSILAISVAKFLDEITKKTKLGTARNIFSLPFF